MNNGSPWAAKAVVAETAGIVRYREVRIPAPTDDDVVVRPEVSWISNGTEGSFVRGERIAGDITWMPGDPLPFPHVPGYQKCGVVESVGKNVKHVREGDRVFASISHIEDMFFSYGGHISPSVTAASEVWKLPETVSSLEASALVLLQVGYNCGIRPPVALGDYAVVIGDGMVGHWVAQTLAHRGARVALVGRHDMRLGKYAVKDGDILINEKVDSVPDCIAQWASGGVNILVDTVGSVQTLTDLYSLMQHDGHIVVAGYYGEQASLDIPQLRAKELTLHTPAGWTKRRMDETLALLAEGVLQTEHLITHRFSVEQAAEAFELILSRREPVLGVVLDW